MSAAPTEPGSEVTNGKIAFTSTRDNGDREIYVMDADGSKQTRLTTSRGFDGYPAFSPDGTKIAFTRSVVGGDSEIYVMDADGKTEPTRLTNSSGSDGYPAFSPDGTKIAFTSNRDGNYEIYVMNADGSKQTQLTNSTGSDGDPTFSPDGTKIAFTSNRDGNSDIYVMNANGSKQTPLTTNTEIDHDPTFSPDGTKIAFTSNRDNDLEIYVMDADGKTEPTRLTNSTGSADDYPAFSPDGTKIAFTSGRDNDLEIYVMDADGTKQTRLTANSAHDYSPSWGVAVDVVDSVPPILSVPDAEAVAATSLAGAAVTYQVSASDEVDGPLTATCEPASGSVFALGVTTVECSATDTAGNTARASFDVSVSVAEGMAGFTVLTDGITDLGLPNGVSNSLLGPLNQVGKLLTDTNPNNDTAGCNKIATFEKQVQNRSDQGRLTPAQADLLTSYATALAASHDCP